MNKFDECDLVLVTTPTCGKCPIIKKFFEDNKTILEKNNLKFEIADASTDEGMEFASNHGIGSAGSVWVKKNDKVYMGIDEVTTIFYGETAIF